MPIMYRPHYCRFKSRTRNAVAAKIYYPCVRDVTCPVLRPRTIPSLAPLSLDGSRDHGSKDSNRVRPVDLRAIRHWGIQVIPHARALSIIATQKRCYLRKRARPAPMWDHPGCVDAQPIPLNRFQRCVELTTVIYFGKPAKRCIMIPMSGRCCWSGWCSTQIDENPANECFSLFLFFFSFFM